MTVAEDKVAIEMENIGEGDSIPLKEDVSPEDKETAEMLPKDGGEPEQESHEIPLSITKPEPFYGLSKAELEPFATDPFWMKLRIALVALTGVVWLAMLIAAIVIVVISPKCPPMPKLKWWQKGVAYSILPESFRDSDGDGFGDLQGIIQSADYLTHLGMSAAYLRSIYQSPWKDFGYDVTDHVAINPMFGTMGDFDAMVKALHARGLKVIMEFIPGQVSREHTWYKDATPDVLGESFYTESSAPATTAKNNLGLNPWGEDTEKGVFYYHDYDSSSAQLNLKDGENLNKLDQVLKFWMNKDVDGFRIENVESLFPVGNVTMEDYQIVINRWKGVLKEASSDEQKRVFIVSSTDTNLLNNLDVDVAVDLSLQNVSSACSHQCAQPALPTLRNAQTGGNSVSRVESRLSGGFADAMNVLLLTSPGISFLYYGEDLGMADVDISSVTNFTDSAAMSRLPERSPMQWTLNPTTGGFTTGSKPWLPIGSDVAKANVQVQLSNGIGRSHTKLVQTLITLKEENSFQWGKLVPFVEPTPSSLVAYVRDAEGFTPYLVAVNLGTEAVHTNLRPVSPGSGHIVVKAATGLLNSADFVVDGNPVSIDSIFLEPGAGFVGQFVDVIPEEDEENGKSGH